MKYITLAGLLLLAFFASHAQTEYQLNNAMAFYRTQKITSGEIRNILTEKDIEGSPYLNDEFIKGSIYTNSKTQFTEIPLRYNIYNDDIEFQTPENKVFALATPEITDKITFGEFTMEYIPFEIARKIKNGFFRVVLKSKVSLYARPEVQYIEPSEPAPYKEAEPAKFIRKDDRYFLRNGMDAAIACANKKEVIAFFPDHNTEIESFIKKNKINVKKEDELKKVVEYYNSL